MPKVYGTCPVDCALDQKRCWQSQYETDGSMKMVDGYPAPPVEVCSAAGKECGCVAEHEIECDGDCYSKKDFPNGCPVDCRAQGNQTCWVDNFDENGDYT